MGHRISRRAFIGASAGVWVAGRQLGYGQEKSANARINIAYIASGGRGGAHLGAGGDENIVALCDVNQANVVKAENTVMANAQKRGRDIDKPKPYTDFRKLYDELGKSIDAVVVSTCEHTHAFAVLTAIKAGKHVYVEKPMTHGIWEARVLREAAAANPKVVTQMGIQMHASDNSRRVVELIQSGAIGNVTEVHVWVHRSWGWQTAEDARTNNDMLSTQERPKTEDPVPAGVDWDLWLGPAPFRPFHKIYFPGPKWYRWWEWGSGTMSDLGSHMNDLPFWALKLKAPRTIEGFGEGAAHADLAPANFHAAYEHGPRGDMPALKYHWYQGTMRPPMYQDVIASRKWGDGHLFIGDKGMLLSSHGKHVLLPEEKFKDFKRPEPTIPNSPGAIQEWVLACKGQGKTMANFDYAGPLTESNHLASIAYRMGKKLEWDPASLKATNCPEADALIKREYRKGWALV
ncbi:MAG TPA: Gfo/Idh/MocA family oxidoreductase [Planctomycetota bacterium]|nr:Gfo/Idh/MocA family oxidoreductase [Planctomycetota bacterium]